MFARLAAEAALGGLAPVTLLALLKHPLLRLGAAASAHHRAIAALERAVLRGPRPRAGTRGARACADDIPRRARTTLHRSDPRTRLGGPISMPRDALVATLGAALAPLESLQRAQPFAAIAALHARRAARAHRRDDAGGAAAFADDDGMELARRLRRDRASSRAGLAVAPGDYRRAVRAAIADRVVRRAGRPGARVRIYGPLEARLQQVDRVVLGGLVEGVWPPETRTDPWLQPADAARARPRPAGAAHRPVGARFRAGARRAAR